MSKTKDFIVTINESRFGIPRENLILDLYESGVYIYDGTIIGIPVMSDGSIVKGIPQLSVGDYKFSSIDFRKKYTIVISGFGITTQIPEKLSDIDIGLPYNVTGTDIPYKNNSNVSIQSAFESLDATSSLPRIISLEDDVEILQNDTTSLNIKVDSLETDVTNLQSDTTNIYNIIGGIDTTSALLPRIEIVEADTTSLNVSVDLLESDVTNLQSDTTSIHFDIDDINNYLHSFSSNKVLVSNNDGTIVTSIITNTEIEALDNITGNIQNQIDNIPDINVFDANDGSVGQILSIAMSGDGTNKIIVPMNISSDSTSGVDYLYLRGTICQHNTVESGKAFFGNIALDYSSGLLYSSSVANYQGTGIITIADSIARASSSKISTGVYKLQCRTNATNTFKGNLLIDYRKFCNLSIPVFGKRNISYDAENEIYTESFDSTQVGYMVLNMLESYYGFYYNSAQLIINTFDMNNTLSDNILELGVKIEIKAFDY